MPRPRKPRAGAGVRALRFAPGFVRQGGQDGGFGRVDPLAVPMLHRELAIGSVVADDIGADELELLQRLVATWDVVQQRDQRTYDVARLEPDGRVVVWPAVAPHVFFAGQGDPLQVLPTFVEQAVTMNVQAGVARLCTFSFAGEGGFQMTPNSLLGVAYAAFALEISDDQRRGPVCFECGKPLEGRQRSTMAFCDEACRARARRRRQSAAAGAADPITQKIVNTDRERNAPAPERWQPGEEQ